MRHLAPARPVPVDGRALRVPAEGNADAARRVRPSRRRDPGGPLLAAYARRGVRVQLAVRDGRREGHASARGDPRPARSWPRSRAEEARCSCRALGIDPPILLGFRTASSARRAVRPGRRWPRSRAPSRKVLQEVRPDAVITLRSGRGLRPPRSSARRRRRDPASSRPGAEGAPARLFYPDSRRTAFPSARAAFLVADRPALPDRTRALRRRGMAASRAALACHKSQFRAEEMEPLAQFMDQVLGGRQHLRPWFGGAKADDLFAVEIP